MALKNLVLRSDRPEPVTRIPATKKVFGHAIYRGKRMLLRNGQMPIFWSKRAAEGEIEELARAGWDKLTIRRCSVSPN